MLAVLFILFSKRIVAKHPAIRKTITKNPLWKAQMALHPVLVFLILDRAVDSPLFYGTLMVPFAFNFGVEPFDIPTDPVFLIFFYLHHYAVVLAAIVTGMAANNVEEEFVRAQALLLGHAWTLHTIGFASHKKWMDKQQSFWPYMMLGFLLKIYWWKELNIPIFSVLRVPAYAQFIGRWGLYLRLCYTEGWHKPSHPNYDAFEWKKQPVEAFAFALAYVLALVMP